MSNPPKTLKIAIMGAKGYPYVYGGYDTLVKELGERLVEKGVSVRVYNHRSLFPIRPQFVNGIECIYTPAIESKSLTVGSPAFLANPQPST
jgi:flavorubredoxin